MNSKIWAMYTILFSIAAKPQVIEYYFMQLVTTAATGVGLGTNLKLMLSLFI